MTAQPLRPSLVAHRGDIQPDAHAYLERLVSPLTGLQKNLVVALRDGVSPRIAVLTGQLTGIHRLLGMDKPLSYHIGGYGESLEEALMRVLGETVERYAHMVYVLDPNRAAERGTVAEMTVRHGARNVLAVDRMDFFSDGQLARPGFPFTRARPDVELGWTRGTDVATGEPAWLPSQVAIVGYLPPAPADGHAPEPRIVPSVTTGTAAHTVPVRALRSALFELVQGHVTTGHWYSAQVAPEIVLDERTPALRRIVERALPRHRCRMRFHHLGGQEFGLHVVAEVLESTMEGEVPGTVLGNGADASLEAAMYKAFIECSAMPHMAIVSFAQGDRTRRTAEGAESGPETAPETASGIDNLDDNVYLYSLPENRKVIDEKFVTEVQVRASELPDDLMAGPGSAADPEAELRAVTKRILGRGARLLLLDMTSPEIADLGFHVFRYYTPDLLPFGLPSYPPAAHRAFGDFGGFAHERPHPYA